MAKARLGWFFPEELAAIRAQRVAGIPFRNALAYWRAKLGYPYSRRAFRRIWDGMSYA